MTSVWNRNNVLRFGALTFVTLLVAAGSATAFPPAGRYSVTIDASGILAAPAGWACSFGAPPGPGPGVEARCFPGAGANVTPDRCEDPEAWGGVRQSPGGILGSASAFADLGVFAICQLAPGSGPGPAPVLANCVAATPEHNSANWWGAPLTTSQCSQRQAGVVTGTAIEVVCHGIPNGSVSYWQASCSYFLSA